MAVAELPFDLMEAKLAVPSIRPGESPSQTSVDQERDLLEVMPSLQDMKARHHDDAEWEH